MKFEIIPGVLDAKRFSNNTFSISDLWVLIATFLAISIFISTYSLLPTLEVFGHDEVHYYKYFEFKLREDGRWINYLLHDFLRSVPVEGWAGMLLLTSWFLFFRLAQPLGFDKVYSALIASTTLLAFPFVAQSLWPATMIPAVLILLFTSVLVKQGVRFELVYVISGVFIFGSLQSFYFLLPLFFFKKFIDQPDKAVNRWFFLIKHLIWWVIGAVAGVLVMSCFLWLKLGHFGAQVADWRQIQPIHNFADLLRNILYVLNALKIQLKQLLIMAGVFKSEFIVFLVLVVIFRIRTLFASYHALLLLILIGLSFFAFSIPLAPVIQERSLIALAAAFVFFIAYVCGLSTIGRMVGALLLTIVAHSFSIHGYTYLNDHNKETAFIYEKLEALLPSIAKNYTSVALFGVVSENSPESRIFNNPPAMHSILHDLGVKDYWDCRYGKDSRCNDLSQGQLISTISFSHGQLQFSVSSDNIGMIHYLNQ